MGTPRSHNHPRDVNPLDDIVAEVREARRAIDGAKGRKARMLRNRELQRELRGKGLADRKLADQHEASTALRHSGLYTDD